MNSGGFELSQSVEQPVTSVELPKPPSEMPNGGKSMEELIQNLENSEPRPETGRKSMAEVIENLERMQPQESSRESVQETTAGGIIRDAISKLSDALFSPKVKDTGGAMRDIEAAAREWHVQEDTYTCAVACQEFIIREYTGGDVTEAELRKLAEIRDWFVETGTPVDDIGKLLEVYGIESSINYEATFQDLRKTLSDGNRTIVAVNNIALSTEWCDGYPFASCNHAIEVIGIDESDPEDIRVIVNDPGVEDGCAKSISYDNFMDAWGTSGGYMMTAYRN